MNKVFLSNGVEFECPPDQSILEAAQKHKIAIEHSCKTGRCGVCIALVIKGQTSPLFNEESLSLSDSESKNILTCCRTIESDTYLDIQDLGQIGEIPVLTLPCRISSLKLLNENVLLVTLRLPPKANFRYVEGQYIDLIHNGTRRSYSIANAPNSDGKIELMVKKVNDGFMSDYLFNRAALNDLLRIEGPQGTFSYRDNGSKNIIFLATGTGIAPVRAMLQKMSMHQMLDREIYVFWGGRYATDLFLDTRKIEGSHQFYAVLSRDDRLSYKGYVQDAVLKSGINLSDSTVYACGSEVMISSSARLLIANGLSSKRFFSDAFVSSN
ncbi:FAD-binding oxidoreductase [Porticoccaceae bacterium]|nr:FAD-binding oxidoreductase [Porticoccaceae bacterium]